MKVISIVFFVLTFGIVSAQKPNVIVIVADDLGWGTVSCYGNKYVQTPHIDRLAKEGIKFTQAYVTPQCTPTRASMMTGQHTARVKMWHVIPKYEYPNALMTEPKFSEHLADTNLTLGDVMQHAGYKTAMFGKWHLTNYESGVGYYTRLFADHADAYGFDEVDPMTDPSEYLGFTDKGVNFLTDLSINYIQKNKQNPFFLLLNHHTIHSKVLAPKELIDKYLQKGYPSEGLHNATYLAAIEHFDNSIGRILETLDEEKLTENTVVMFVSDNGGVDAEFDNAPLRYGKGSVYEGGIRVPFIVRYPKEIKAGQVSDELVQAADFLPTIADFAENKTYEKAGIDGVSLRPAFQGKKLDKRSLYWYAPLYDTQWGAVPAAVIRSGKYKLIEHFGDYLDLDDNARYITKGRTELFDIESDISERNDLASAKPKILKKMKADLYEWMNDLDLEIPVKNPNYDPEKALVRPPRIKK